MNANLYCFEIEPVLVTSRTSTGHLGEQYWSRVGPVLVASSTSTGSFLWLYGRRDAVIADGVFDRVVCCLLLGSGAVWCRTNKATYGACRLSYIHRQGEVVSQITHRAL